MIDNPIDENMAIPSGVAIPKDTRPVFLKVLCILTFTGSGLALIKNLFVLATFSATKSSLTFAGTMYSQVSSRNIFGWAIPNPYAVSNFLNWTLWGAYIGLIACILTLVGALLMWQMKRLGYFVYIAGEVLVFASATVMMFIASKMGMFGMRSLIFAILVMVTTAGFAVMYTLNLKHLKRIGND